MEENFNEFIESYLIEYKKSFGEIKFNKILEKVQNSEKIKRLIIHTLVNRLTITPTVILATLNELPYFMFSKAETLATGAILVLIWWVTEVNETIYIATDEELKNIAYFIIKRCNNLKIHI